MKWKLGDNCRDCFVPIQMYKKYPFDAYFKEALRCPSCKKIYFVNKNDEKNKIKRKITRIMQDDEEKEIIQIMF
jgi:Zn-finger protein